MTDPKHLEQQILNPEQNRREEMFLFAARVSAMADANPRTVYQKLYLLYFKRKEPDHHV